MTGNLRISTMTAISAFVDNNDFPILINLDAFLNNININENFIQFIQTDKGYRGDCVKLHKRRRKNPNKRTTFMNQISMCIKCEGKVKPINLKFFRNGKIQSTGLLSDTMLLIVLKKLIIYINNLDNNFCQELKIFSSQEINIKPIKICLINSDFDFGFPLSRENIFEDLLSDDYITHLNVDMYPGLLIKYYIGGKDGVCNCECICNGKGEGSGAPGDCSVVTIAIFLSGKALITGASSKNQIDEAYKFINNYINKNKEKYIILR